jgi:hypothetical protein
MFNVQRLTANSESFREQASNAEQIERERSSTDWSERVRATCKAKPRGSGEQSGRAANDFADLQKLPRGVFLLKQFV